MQCKLYGQDLERVDIKNPVRLTSGIGLQTSFYSVSNIPYRRQPFNWSISGTPVLQLYGMNLPFSFYFSNQQLKYQQPFNQFGISPTYKWAKAHLGYSSVRFSDHTLAGRRFLGAGLELNPGKLRLGFIYGRFQKAIERDSVVQSTPEGYLSGVPNGSFERKGYAVKVGIGTDKDYVDLIYLKAEDAPASLVESFSLETLNPKKNSALGLKHRISSEGGFFWESDAALSFYTRDLNAEPIDTGDIPTFLYKLFDPKLTSQLLYAGSMRIGYEGKAIKTSLRFRRISRDFKTMGAYYFQTDLQEYALQLGTALFKNKMHVRGSAGFQENNLASDRLHTTKRFIASFYSGLQLAQNLRCDLIYSNFGITQRPQQPGLADSIRIDQVLQSWQLALNYQIRSARPQTISFQVNTQDLAPREEGFSQVTETKSFNMNGVYIISFPTAHFNVSLVGQSIRNEQVVGTLKCIGGGISLTKGFAKGKGNANSGIRLFNTQFEELDGGSTITFDAGINYRITDTWSAGANVRLIHSDGTTQAMQQFNERLVTLASQFHF